MPLPPPTGTSVVYFIGMVGSVSARRLSGCAAAPGALSCTCALRVCGCAIFACGCAHAHAPSGRASGLLTPEAAEHANTCASRQCVPASKSLPSSHPTTLLLVAVTDRILCGCFSRKCFPRTCSDDGFFVLPSRAHFVTVVLRRRLLLYRTGPMASHGHTPGWCGGHDARASVPGDPWLGIVAGGHVVVGRVLGTVP